MVERGGMNDDGHDTDTLPKRCPMCGKAVTNFFEHVDVNCSQWPDEPKGEANVDYRGWEVGYDSMAGHFTREGWIAYKGGCDIGAPAVSGATFEAVLREIDGEEE